MDATDFEAAGLYEPGAQGAEVRLALLEHLCDRGATVDQLVEAAALGRLPVLAGDLERHAGDERCSAREAAERAGISLELLARVWRASGFPDLDPDDPFLTSTDVDTFRAFAHGADIFGEAPTLQFGRTVGAAMASVADAAIAMFGLTLQPRLHQGDANEMEWAQASELANAAVRDEIPVALIGLFHQHFESAVRRAEIAEAGTGFGDGRTVRFAIGFLDLVGSTPLALDLTPAELGEVVADFEGVTSSAVARHDGRVVKHIGDEVMFVVPDVGNACEVSLDLTERFGPASGTPLLRGGLAFGDLVRGYGDYYGPFVNLAARAVKLAEPGVVLVTDEVRAAVADRPGFRFVPAGEQVPRGFDTSVPLFALERA